MSVFSRIARVQRPVIRFVQRVLLSGSLFLLYWIGFGLSRVFMTVFARRTLHHRHAPRSGEDTYWREAEGYDLDPAGLHRQS